eukprot:TRINITY_DN4857_c0_g1_i14.p2 TRINITY_DN4857_c0_g1~~TRINITY_DN4857_c0_g1_i14.p2  ORF type:complete len:186 (-),score=32.81 TRINITY_DN4857_c0_g1_i14:288-845(-)
MLSATGRGMRRLVAAAGPIRYSLVALWDGLDHREAAGIVAGDILKANPKCSGIEALNQGMAFAKNGALVSWDLEGCGLVALPESFGTVRVETDLLLLNNSLQTLPESFAHLQVGRHLYLTRNMLVTLPESIGALRVPGHLSLGFNCLKSLPASFALVHTGGDLRLMFNPLTSWPQFPNVQGTVSK